MATIDLVKVRAIIRMGSLKIETPYIQSFSVKKSRGAISTFDASLKVEAGKVSGAITGSKVIIHAGVKSNLNKIFTGMVRQAKISPCFDDPQFVLISVSGSDDLILLNGKKYSRRCRATKSKYVTITGVVRAGLKTTGLNYEKDPFIEIDSGILEKDSVVVAASDMTLPGDIPVSSPPAIEGKTGAALSTTLREVGD